LKIPPTIFVWLLLSFPTKFSEGRIQTQKTPLSATCRKGTSRGSLTRGGITLMQCIRPRLVPGLLVVRGSRNFTARASAGLPTADAMQNRSMSSALAFDLKARCSVWQDSSRLKPPPFPSPVILTNFATKLDVQSSGFGLEPPPWPGRTPRLHAGGHPGLSEGTDPGTTGGDGMQTVSQQHVPLGPEARSSRAGPNWRRA